MLAKHGRFPIFTQLTKALASADPEVLHTTEAGLFAIAAYTSAGLDRFIHEAHSLMGGPRHRREDIKLLETLTGVVDVSAFSTFSGAHARGEKEGLLLPGQMYRVLQITPGQESSPLDPPVTEKATHVEQWRVLLRECEGLTTPGGA